MGQHSDSPVTPSFDHEQALLRDHGGPVAGIDEAGRGPWAGPVVAAAVILDANSTPEGLNDSKALSEVKRDSLFDQIMETAIVGVGIADVGRIDRDNILNATLWAMAQACTTLETAPAAALVDGNRCPHDLPCPARPLVKGDALSLSISAASIIAKVTRDRIMRDLALAHPAYGWERNKGYGTREHSEALLRFGVTSHHRQSFRPVQAVLAGWAARKAG